MGMGSPLEQQHANLAEFELIAARVSESAGGLIRDLRARAEVRIDTKSSPVDVVTNADRAAEAEIIAGLVAARPQDAVLGEESGHSVDGTSGITWVIDPIDGTTNFVYGLHAACVSVAATVDPDDVRWQSLPPSPHWHGTADAPVRRTIAAAVYNPFTDELFTAHAGGGATRNGQAIRVKEHVSLATALIATGFGYTAERRREQGAMLLELLPQIRDIRRLGSAAYDLCLLAQGSLDGYYERGIQEWDFAAGALIASEAGATLSGASAGELPSSRLFIAGSAHLTDALQRIVGKLAGP